MIEYRKKNYTQGFLRNKIINRIINQGKSYRIVSKELGIGSIGTISKWVNRGSIDSKSSAPIIPNRKYNFSELYYLHAIKNNSNCL